jgi:SAM-dependent methyltransferase
MPTPKDILGHISGGRVLDVATGSGNFTYFLLDGLKDYAEIIGIDTNERGAAAFAEVFKEQPNVRFEAVDALEMGYPDASFDTVCIANSLHHFNDPQAVLHQMARVLRPGGCFMVAEMYRDGQSETQMTHVHLHHWWAAIDRAAGIIHNETYTREDLLALVAFLGLDDLKLQDLSDTEEDPKNPETLAQLDPVIDRYIQRAEGRPDLQTRGEALRQRLHEIGFHGATSLIALGMKPDH